VIVDRSLLAANLYKLLLAPLGAVIAVRRRFEEARPDIARRGAVQLLIINCNAVGKKYSEVAAELEREASLADVPKVFFCEEGEAESIMRKRLAQIPKAEVISRPFHPDEFAALVNKLLRRETR